MKGFFNNVTAAASQLAQQAQAQVAQRTHSGAALTSSAVRAQRGP